MLLFDRKAMWTCPLKRACLRVCAAANKHKTPRVSLNSAVNANQAAFGETTWG